MIQTTLGEIADIIDGGVIGDRAVLVRGVGIDTRADLTGRLFVPIRGDRHDGHDHLSGAAASGAVATLVDRAWLAEGRDSGGLPLVTVDDTVAALGRLAAVHREGFEGRVVGVTGSAGKTTTRALLERVLARAGTGTASIRSFNNHIGVPLTLLEADASDIWVVLEMGMSHPGEIARLVEIARPEIAIITGTGRAHLEGLGDEAAVAREKATILDGAGLGIVNVDRPAILSELERRLDTSTEILTYGLSNRAGIRILDRTPRPEGGQRIETEDFRADLSLDGAHNAANAIAAMIVGRRFGVADEAIAEALAEAAPPDMRFVRHAIGSLLVIDDSYNANPESMRASIDAFLEVGVDRPRRIAVLGSMLELGPEGPEMHAEVGRSLAGRAIDVLVGVGQGGGQLVAAATRAGFGGLVVAAENAEDAKGRLETLVEDGDAILVKASRGLGLDAVVSSLRSGTESDA